MGESCGKAQAPFGRRVGAVIGLALVALALGNVPGASAAPPQDPNINDIVDAFIVDGEHETATQQPWFCLPENTDRNRATPHTKCTVASYTAAARLVYAYAVELQNRQPNADGSYPQVPGDSVPAFMRAGKARNDCEEGEPAECVTGVPKKPSSPCPGFWAYDAGTSPWCPLDWLSRVAKIKLGVVVSANNGHDVARSVRDISYQACKIAREDDTGLYSFVFLDFARLLDIQKRRDVVNLIQRGEVLGDNGVPRDCAVTHGYRVMTNDQHYDKQGPGELDTNAWAHAKDLEILRKPNLQANLADGNPLESSDKDFIDDVQARGSQAVLRFEVTAQTGQLARLTLSTQCQLLGALGRYQRGGYSIIYPTFVHGSIGGDNDNPPYDSFATDSQWSGHRTDTFGLQSKLLRMYPGSSLDPPSACP